MGNCCAGDKKRSRYQSIFKELQTIYPGTSTIYVLDYDGQIMFVISSLLLFPPFFFFLFQTFSLTNGTNKKTKSSKLFGHFKG
jgi:hypothetical protein